MPTGKFVPTPVTSADGKQTWKGRGRKPSWLKKQEADATNAVVATQDAVAPAAEVK